LGCYFPFLNKGTKPGACNPTQEAEIRRVMVQNQPG
jgi:hypothetical protein